ncbi:MAG: carbohydrate binding domain-containing protein [Bacteroidales bacterium]|nr:carbohydrate binding domain-containing protein [Bacteroidales bacterium]
MELEYNLKENNMKQGFLIIILFFSTIVYISAQENLVYNGSFEEHWYCPPVISQDSFPCKGWYSPNLGTPDYFHVCSTDSFLSNSHNCFSSHSGNACIGLGLISIEYAWIEHIQSQLKEPLKAGQKYKVSFWVRLDYQYSDYTAYNIGVYFSKNKKIFGDYLLSKHNYIEGMTPELQAHVSNEKGKFIIDTTWKEISGIYTAQGEEKYITIGMFWDDNPKVVKAWEKAKKNQSWGNTKRFGKIVKKYLLKKNPYMEDKYKNFLLKGGQHYPYYLIDDVSVIELN